MKSFKHSTPHNILIQSKNTTKNTVLPTEVEVISIVLQPQHKIYKLHEQ